MEDNKPTDGAEYISLEGVVFFEKDQMRDGAFRKKQYLCKKFSEDGFRTSNIPQVGTTIR